ncbi:MAG: FAD-binding oxidoreductase [Chloroflexi bacterium]|nr:FAD-binding oxidoreductase [Chloroflexota bacterium]
MITADVAVVGGGVHGASTAFNLAERSVTNVAVFEKSFIGAGATGKSSGLVRFHYTNVQEVTLTWVSYRDWFLVWKERVGGECGLVDHVGMLRIVPEHHVTNLRGALAMMRAVGVDTYEVDAQQVREIEPQLDVSDITVAGFEPQSGYADPSSTAVSLMEAARQRGVRLFQGVEVHGVKVEGGRVVGLETSAGDVSAPVVLVANNAWAPRLLGKLGVDVPISPEWHQVAVFYRPPSVGRHVMCIDSILDMYFRIEGQNMTLLGTGEGKPHADPDSYDSRPTMEFWAEAAEKLTQRMPAMADASAGRGMTGIYDVTPDGKPLLGPVPGIDGLYVQAGFCGTGFKIAPAVGDMMAELITTGKTTLLDWRPLRLTRFAEGEPLMGEFEYLTETGKRKDAWLM